MPCYSVTVETPTQVLTTISTPKLRSYVEELKQAVISPEDQTFEGFPSYTEELKYVATVTDLNAAVNDTETRVEDWFIY